MIFGEFMHGTERSLIDVDQNEKIVAHEMFHHWFGDYVTCESWSNLTLNEGFANYSEYLWMEEKHGRDAADNHLLSEQGGYFSSVRRGEPHELIWYDYDDKEQMFDAHSYNKGGSVLHMLRGYLGDEAFFAGLEKYLTDNQYSAVEVDELRIAFEDLVGEDMKWFFDQWFLAAGHPELSLTTGYADGQVTLTVEQTQSTDNNVPAIFRLPTQVAILKNGSPVAEMHDIVVDQREQTFTFASDVAPDVVIFDPHHNLLATFDYTKTASELAAQFQGAQSYIDRMLTVQRMAGKEPSADKEQLLTAALQDPFYAIRSAALEVIESPTAAQMELIKQIAMNDAHSQTRATAIAALETSASFDREQLKSIATDALQGRPYPVVAAGLSVLAELDPAAAAETAADMESLDNDDIAGAIAQLYSQTGDVSKLSYFEERMDKADGPGAVALLESYQALLNQAQDTQIEQGVAKMKAIALLQTGSPWRRLAATAALDKLRVSNRTMADKAEMVEQLGTIISEIKEAETEPQLQQIYGQFGK